MKKLLLYLGLFCSVGMLEASDQGENYESALDRLGVSLEDLKLPAGDLRKVISSAYRGLAKEAHPDKKKGNAEAMKAISGARDALLIGCRLSEGFEKWRKNFKRKRSTAKRKRPTTLEEYKIEWEKRFKYLSDEVKNHLLQAKSNYELLDSSLYHLIKQTINDSLYQANIVLNQFEESLQRECEAASNNEKASKKMGKEVFVLPEKDIQNMRKKWSAVRNSFNVTENEFKQIKNKRFWRRALIAGALSAAVATTYVCVKQPSWFTSMKSAVRSLLVRKGRRRECEII